jgi:L-aspartate oxidase
VEHFQGRRYLVSFDASLVPQIFCDVLVIGSGVAGLRAALAAAESAKVLVLCKGRLDESNTAQAQGGIAAAMAPEDAPADHMKDTLAAGQGLCDEEVVRVITEEAPGRIRELVDWGACFDREGEGIALTREGGHSAARIVHARGDATGREVAVTLIRRVKETPAIQVAENAFVLDLITTEEEGCLGAVMHVRRQGPRIVWAKTVVLASGGAGRVFRESTNPNVATGDGLAMAFRAGAEIADIEFFQFHPTALYVAGASRSLISEAVRGEGGILLNARGERFMAKYHERGELAPRDAVSRAIVAEIRETGHTCAYLDMRHISNLKARFPSICELCGQFDIDIARELVPIRPAAHYMVGGVRIGLNGETNVPRLLACGEVACSGLHGANRLGSNSLLEGMVIGGRAGEEALRIAATLPGEITPRRIQVRNAAPQRDEIDADDVTNSLRAVAWRNLGIERNRFGMEEAIHMMRFWGRYVMDKEFRARDGWELQNMLLAARLIAEAALTREESRGVHYRTDHPKSDPAWKRHIILCKDRPLRMGPAE